MNVCLWHRKIETLFGDVVQIFYRGKLYYHMSASGKLIEIPSGIKSKERR